MVNMPGMACPAFNLLLISCASLRTQLTGPRQYWFLCPLYYHHLYFQVALIVQIAILFILLTQCAS